MSHQLSLAIRRWTFNVSLTAGEAGASVCANAINNNKCFKFKWRLPYPAHDPLLQQSSAIRKAKQSHATFGAEQVNDLAPSSQTNIHYN